MIIPPGYGKTYCLYYLNCITDYCCFSCVAVYEAYQVQALMDIAFIIFCFYGCTQDDSTIRIPEGNTVIHMGNDRRMDGCTDLFSYHFWSYSDTGDFLFT